jgi:hypothetical protein
VEKVSKAKNKKLGAGRGEKKVPKKKKLTSAMRKGKENKSI